MSQSSPPKRTIQSFLIQATAIFLAVLVILEFAARTSWAQRTLTYRSVGNYHYQFEIKWFRLHEYVEQNGGVDVIILGSSLVNTGVDPDVMAQTYFEQTGQRIRIFNFGVEGLTVAPNSVNARILVKKYRPALLIYVTEMRDYIATTGLDYQQLFLSNPWIQNQQGNFNLPGWLVDHSMALQYFLPYRNWMRADFPQSIYSLIRRSQNTSSSGYEPEMAMGENIGSPPDPNDPEEAKNFTAYGNFQMAPSRLESLQSILTLNQEKGTKVLVVEMPVHPTFYDYVGGEAIHQQFQLTISSIVRSNGGSFLPAEKCNDIPLVGRANRWHLNYLGAPVFSTCLGRQLAILANQLNTDFINMDVIGSK
jgi:hypothetical protein